MTQEEIIKLAHTAGFNWPDIQATTIEQRLERFASLVAATEREKFTNTQEFVTLPRDVVEQALEAFMRGCPPDCKDGMTDSGGVHPWGEAALIQCPSCRAVEVLRAALDQQQNHVPDAGNMVPAGWKLVPVELTEEMLRAGCGSESPAMFRESLTDKQIDAIAESMPGGLDGFLKGWGWRQFARAVLEAAPQPPTIKECLTDELKPRFSAHDDAERLKSVARGMSYNDHGEAVWKHTLMEIAVRLESGGYAAPQPPALEQQVEKESTCKDYLQVEQEPVAVIGDVWTLNWVGGDPIATIVKKYGLKIGTKLYTHPQNLRCKSTQKRLATLWGYVKAGQLQGEQEICCKIWSVNHIDALGKIVDSSGRLIATVYGSQADTIVACHNSHANPQPKREPLTDDDVERLWYQNRGGLWYQNQGISLRFARAIEAAHNIK